MQEAIELYKNGLTIEKASETAKVSFPGLQYQLNKLGLARSNKENSKRHTPEMLEQALSLYKKGYSLDEVYSKTKVSKYTLRIKIKELQIIKIKKEKTNLLLDQSIELYKSGLSTLKVAKQTGIQLGVLTRRLNKLGIIRNNSINSRKFDANHNFFKHIDTEEKAYWLGFIYADGYITTNKGKGKSLGISLNRKDEQHLEIFRNQIEATYPIKHYINNAWGVKVKYCRLLMRSDQLFDDLKNKGAVERKSLILKFPEQDTIPVNLLHHFLRGYFDGDGSFAKHSKEIEYTFKLCGTKEFLNSFSEHINFPNRNLSKRKKDKKNNWCLEIGGRLQVVSIGDYLYKDANVYLNRKYQRYLKLKNKI